MYFRSCCNYFQHPLLLKWWPWSKLCDDGCHSRFQTVCFNPSDCFSIGTDGRPKSLWPRQQAPHSWSSCWLQCSENATNVTKQNVHYDHYTPDIFDHNWLPASGTQHCRVVERDGRQTERGNLKHEQLQNDGDGNNYNRNGNNYHRNGNNKKNGVQ